MSGPDDEQLRRLLARRVSEASAQALRAEGELAPEQLTRLERLARLVAIADAARLAERRRRWPLAAALGVTLALVSVLLFAHVRETVVEIELAVQEIGFTLPVSQRLTDDLPLVSLGASGLKRIELPRGDAGGPDGLDAGQFDISVNTPQRGGVSLAALTPPAAAKVWFSPGDASGQLRLSIDGSSQTLRATAWGAVRIVAGGSAPQAREFTSPRGLAMHAAAGVIDLDLGFADASRVVLASQAKVSGLSFARVEQLESAEGTLVRRMSTLLSGTLVFEELDAATRTLRAGEMLRFDASEGVIRTLELRGDHVAVTFHGKVRGMRSGDESTVRSLMPTMLDWLRAQHGLSLFWGSSLYLFGLIAAALRWWGVKT